MELKMKIELLAHQLSRRNSNHLTPIKTNAKRRCIFKNQQKRKLNLSKLPSPIIFYKNLGFYLKDKSAWSMMLCPFHDDKHASLGISNAHGGFKCHACGESGDMLAFYMKFKNIDFKTACTELALWEEY